MKKIKSLFVALIASFGMLTTLADGLGIYINDVEVGAGSPPKDCGWTHKKSADILPFPADLTWRENENVITFTKPGEYAISGSNTTDHVQIVIDADCTLVLEDCYLHAKKMQVAYAAGALTANAYTRQYPAVTVNPKRHATIAIWGERVLLKGSFERSFFNDGVFADVCVAPNASLVLDDWNGGTVQADMISVFNQGTLTVESRFSPDVYCSNSGEVNYYGKGTLVYDPSKFSWYIAKNSKFGKYITVERYAYYDSFREKTGLMVDSELPDATYYGVDCSTGILNMRGSGKLETSSKSNPDVPIKAKKIYFGGGMLKLSSIKNQSIAADEITIAGGSIEVARQISAEKKITITGGSVHAGGCITAPEIEISGGVVSANGEWGSFRYINLIDVRYAINNADDHLPAIGRQNGCVKISGGTVRTNVDDVDFDYNTAFVLNGRNNGALTYDWKRRGCAGIGGDGTSVIITGGKIYAEGGGLTISDAQYQMSGAGIGGGYQQRCGFIRITGGDVHAAGGKYACGIGPGTQGTYMEGVEISGGKVLAEGGRECPGIWCGRPGVIAISGGTVSAVATYAAGVTDVVGISPYHGQNSNDAKPKVTGCSLDARSLNGVVDAKGALCHRVTVNGGSDIKADIQGLPYTYKDVSFDSDGLIYLWLPDGEYDFVVNGDRFTATVGGENVDAMYTGTCSYKITLDANGGTVDGEKSSTVLCSYGSELGELPVPVREGYEFLGWRWNSEEDHLPPSWIVRCDMNLSAHWRSKAEIAQESGGSHQGEVGCLFKTDFFSRGGHFADGGKERELWFPKGSAISLSELPVPVPDDANDMFYGWYDWEENRYLQDGDVLAYGHNFLAAFTEKSKTVVTFYRCVNVTPPNYEAGGKITVSWDSLGLDYISPGGWAGHRFKGWFSQPDGKGVQYVQDWNGSTHYVKTDDTPTVWYGYWQLISVDWTMNRYNCANVRDLGVELPAVQFRKTVTAENLPKGLKLVEDKATHAWYIEGVPTEARDIEKNYAVVRCKYKDGSPDKVMKVMLNVLPDAHAERTFEIKSICSVPAADFFGEPVDKDWKVSGLAANLKYATKDNTKWTDAAKAQHVESALTIYGQPNKIGPMTVLGKKTVKSQVPGNKTKYTEVHSVEVLVTPVGGSYDAKFTAYANELMDIFDATAAFATADDPKTTASGLPTGMKFSAKAIANNKDYGTTIPAGAFYGKPTKIGLFAVTLKDKDKNEGYVLVRVADPAAPEVGAYFGTKKTKLMKAISAGDAEAEQNKPITLMVGATTSIPLSASAGAAVKASGLPTGLKLAQDKKTKLWTIQGVPSKAGTFLAKVTATLNKVATAVAYIFEVEPNAFAGEWRGHMVSRAEADDWAKTLSGVTVSVAAGGATKVTLVEKGVSRAYSFKSFDWDDLNGNASVSFTTKATKTSPIARDVTLEIVDKGGWFAVTGRVRREGVDADGFIEAYPVVKAAELAERGVLAGIEPSRVWSFAEDLSGEGMYAPYALLTSTLDAKKAKAKVGGKLPSGMKIAVSNLPVVRVGDDPEALASYAFAPFTVYDKTSESTRLFCLSPDGSGWDVWYDEYDYELRGGEWIVCDTAAYTASAAVSLGEFCTERLLLFCEFPGDGSEMLVVEKDAKGKLTAYDATGAKLAAVTAKVAKDGTVSFKLTSADRVFTYAFELVAVAEDGLTGFVTRSWKDGKKSLSAVGTVDAVGL